MKRLLVLGANGMLGQELIRQFSAEEEYETFGAGRRDTDFCLDLLNNEALERVFASVKPDIVINTAANIRIDVCEQRKGAAYLINARMPSQITDYCREYGSYLIQVSTDHFYVDDGRRKHTETEPVRLVNEYARTKYAGEQFVLTYPDSLVLRTNIVGFRGRTKGIKTFLEWVVSTLSSGQPIDVYDDFYTSSMHICDFTRLLRELLMLHPTGLYNFASSEVSSKMEFILEIAKALFAMSPEYHIKSIKEHAGERRADSLGLDTAKVEALLGRRMPTRAETIESIRIEYEKRYA